MGQIRETFISLKCFGRIVCLGILDPIMATHAKTVYKFALREMSLSEKINPI